MKKINIRKSNYDDMLKNVENWKIPTSQKKEIYTFFNDYELGKITGRIADKSTLEHYLIYLKVAFEYINKPTDKLTVEAIDAFSQALLKDEVKSGHHRNFAMSVKIKIRRTLTQFLEWKSPKDVGLLTKSLKVKVNIKRIEPEYLSEEEIDELYKNCKNAEERYLIAMLFSSGARESEFYNIRFSDIQMPKKDESFVKVTLREDFSKTKGRTISLYYKNALEAVNDYLHQRKKDNYQEDDPVWNILPTTARKRLNSFGIIRRKVIKDGKEEFRDGGRKVLKKFIHFHLFRHSCATWLAPKLNRQELCYYFGWRFSSPMPDVYISRGGVHQDELDKKFESTKFEDLKEDLDKQSRENSLLKEKQDILEAELEKRSKFDPLLNKLMNNPKIIEIIGNLVEA
jgi:integrase